MARYALDGIVPDQVICENLALSNTGDNLTCTNTVKLDSRKANSLRVKIYAASQTVEIVNGQSITFTPLFGTNPAAGGCLSRAMGSMTLTGGAVTLKDPGSVTTTSFPASLSWTSGQLIHEFQIPAALVGANTYMKLNVSTSADERVDFIDAYLIAD